MLILVTGASGQLGKSIKKLIKNTKIKHDFVFATRNHLDLSYLEDIKSYFKDSNIDLIINCAISKSSSSSFSSSSLLSSSPLPSSFALVFILY
jgi:dTDP-4-dehydrorhamnose reductase